MKHSPTIPPHAVSLWLEGNQIHMDLPAIGRDVSHRLTFPNDIYGLQRAVYLLKQRNASSLIGTEGDITQAQLDRKIRNMKDKALVDEAGEKVRKVKPKEAFSPTVGSAARDILRRLGI